MGTTCKFAAFASIALILPAAACVAAAAEVRSGDLVISVEKDGCGLIDSATFDGRKVIQTHPGFVGGSVALVPAGKGDADSLFAAAVSLVLAAKVSAVETAGGKLVVAGAYTDGKIRVPFRREYSPAPGGAVAVVEQADFTQLGDDCAVARHTLDLPLAVCKDEHLRLLAFGGATRVEMFRMDMNDERRRNQLISSPRGFWPYWDIGGVVQLPTSYRIWKANHADTIAYPVDDGRGAPGWADYSEPDWGLTAQVPDAARAAPWAIRIDARKGVFSIQPRPGDQMPISARDYGKCELRFVLAFHRTSWPATYPCELPVEAYKQLLDYLNEGKGYTHLNNACGALGIEMADGKQTPEQMKSVYERVIFKERVQPSVILRIFYRGDAWRMGGIVRDILGRSVPRNQPIAEWEKVAQALLAKLRKDGLPAKKPSTD